MITVDRIGALTELYASLESRIERALISGGQAVARLGAAGTSVTFHVIGEGVEERVTLLLDREPPELSDNSDAEITVELDPEAARQFARGEMVLAMRLIDGTARYRGPIRKYLAVDPILRGLLAEVESSGEKDGER